MTTLTLTLEPCYGGILAEEDTDLDTGTVRYRVKATRAAGTFLIYPKRYGQAAIPTDIQVQFGDGNHYNDRDHTDRPVINGIRILGGAVFDPADIDEFDARSMYVGRPNQWHGTDRVPDATGAYTLAIVRALVWHWRARPDVDQLRLASARRTAAGRLPDLERTITKLRADAQALLDSLMEKEQARDDLRALLETAPADPATAPIPA